MKLSYLRRPTPLWFSILKLILVICVFLWLGYDGNFKPVGNEVATVISQFSEALDRETKAMQAQAQAAKESGTSEPQQPINHGAAK